MKVFVLCGPRATGPLLGPGEFGYAHGSLVVTSKNSGIGLLLGMAQSLLTDPECKPAGISMVETARPGGEGLMSRSNRAASGPHWDAAGIGYSKPAVRARMMAWARSET